MAASVTAALNDSNKLANNYSGHGVCFGNESDGSGWVEDPPESGTWTWSPMDDGVYFNTQSVETGVFQALGGDTDGDVDVDFTDFNNLANNYTGSLPAGTGGKEWRQGDFDGDEDVDFGDFNTLANHYTGAGIRYPYTGGAAAGSGGGGEGALIGDMLAANQTPPAWLRDYWLARVYELQPVWLADLEQFLADDQSSDQGTSADAVDHLMELLLTYWA